MLIKMNLADAKAACDILSDMKCVLRYKIEYKIDPDYERCTKELQDIEQLSESLSLKIYNYIKELENINNSIEIAKLY